MLLTGSTSTKVIPRSKLGFNPLTVVYSGAASTKCGIDIKIGAPLANNYQNEHFFS